MSWSFSIGHILGSDLRVHATFFLLLAWIGTVTWLAEGPAATFANLAFVLALFACVVAHEFGHALMARRYGVRTPDITLLPIGGMARLEKIPEYPREEIAVALAGPAVNVVIWLVLVLGFGVRGNPAELVSLEDPSQSFLERLAAVNLFLVVFNMIPAFPMDGGRVFRAVLAGSMGRVRATRWAARAGQAIAFLFGYLGLVSGNPILILIAIFVFMAAMAESSDVEMHDLVKGVMARDAMITAYEALAPGDTLPAAEMALLRTTQSEFPVVNADGTLAGILAKSAIIAHHQGATQAAKVADVMLGEVPTLMLTDPLERALDALHQPNTPAVAVTDRKGLFLGYITRENIGEWVVLSSRPRAS
ncbi:site-2 protease family protein [Marivita sp.]|uniref:site-2 protease family protein n=1 Tax=Marivita sp. TaxID=2003365 RepID=UPI0025C5B358|nr:site-2 protease family protein [Marivita sp.]